MQPVATSQSGYTAVEQKATKLYVVDQLEQLKNLTERKDFNLTPYLHSLVYIYLALHSFALLHQKA